MKNAVNKKKILNDPVYGFISVPGELLFDLIEHPVFQRLRRIKQLGLTEFVYPGALHTRFHHALGAMHLMQLALQTLQAKGVRVTDAECEAAQVAILLHDVGHGPFSHALETAIFHQVRHEQVSLHLMEMLNGEFGGKLGLAIQMFRGTYERPFFHQLISSQLDVDRLDYLRRDSFYTGVSEGQIGADRLLKMLTVVDDRLVMEEKAILSIESFLVSRRLMYWQVYLHHAVLSAEHMVLRLVQRARILLARGHAVPASPDLYYFLSRELTFPAFVADPTALPHFTALDDVDIWAAIKQWRHHPDAVLRLLAAGILDRRLFKISLSSTPFDPDLLPGTRDLVAATFSLNEEDAAHLVIAGRVGNNAYDASGAGPIQVLTKTGYVLDVTEASDLPNIQALSQKVEKFFVCYPKEILV